MLAKVYVLTERDKRGVPIFSGATPFGSLAEAKGSSHGSTPWRKYTNRRLPTYWISPIKTDGAIYGSACITEHIINVTPLDAISCAALGVALSEA